MTGGPRAFAFAVPVPVPFGVYVHVPFCAARCDYCAFATWTDRDHLMDAYAAGLRHGDTPGPARRGARPRPRPCSWGAGTPSRLPAGLLADILDAVGPAPGAEVTVECNPEDASAPRFAAWHDAGVTRVSFGVQSMVPHVLAGLGRRHGTTRRPARHGARRRGGLRVA